MSVVKRALWAIALVLIAAALIGNAMLSYRNTETLAAGNAASLRSREVLNAIDDLMSTVTEAETGQRGYLLTQSAAYLDPYRSASHSVSANLANLKALLAENSAQLNRLAQLEPLLTAKFDELRRTLDLLESGHRDAALALVTTDQGMRDMHAIREQVGALRAAELSLQAERDAHAADVYRFSQYSRILGMCVGLALVLLAAVLRRRDRQARARAANEIFLQREWFSTTLRSIGDAVIVTDPRGHIVLVNPVAEAMTGWSAQDAVGKPLLEVFDIINETTRQRADNPVARALAEGKIVGLANHTVLRSRYGREYVIEDSAAPTYDANGVIQGAVMVFHDSTQRREAEIALSTASTEVARRASAAMASERTLKTILENAPIGISMTGPGPDFPIIAISHQMRAWIGAAENTPAHAAYRKIMPDGSTPPAAMLPLNRAMHEGLTVRDEQWIIERPGKAPLTVIVNVAPVRDTDGTIVGAVHSWVDLTERQQLDRALRVTESRLRVLVEANVIGLILSFAHNGRVTQANGAFLEMLGFSVEDLAAGEINLITQTPAAYRTADDVAFKELAELGYCAPYEKELFSRNSDRRVSVVVGYARVSGVEDEYVGFALDVSARKKLESQLREQAEELLLADRRKDEFLAMLAHELRNPLAPLRNAVHLLDTRKETDAALVASLVPAMRRQIEHLVRLVDDLLDAARISQGKITLERSVVELQSILYAAVETIQPLINVRRHRLDLDLNPQLLYVHGDSTRLTQMFANILHNAAKYTNDCGSIRVSLVQEANEAVVRVRDSGQGIAADLLPRIFETFTQADQSLARSAGGLGIGLALVHRLSDLHGGSVIARSDGPGTGSEFELRLPLTQARDTTAATVRTAAPATGGRHRILIVDDNIDLAASTAALLELWGHAAHVVYNGKDALDAAHSFRPEVILLDIGLPEMDGFQVAQQIRGEPEMQAVHLIAMTGYGQDRDRLRAQQAGFNAHLVKPVQPDALKLLLESLQS
ncbi:MAG: CHASE3 domain-containing protein [Rudaea sp.]|nr:CHASE3 domain-containing protein [Rudaea sp.]